MTVPSRMVDMIDLLVTYMVEATLDFGVVGIETVEKGRRFFQALDIEASEGSLAEVVSYRPSIIGPNQLGRILLAQYIRSSISSYNSENLEHADIKSYSEQLEKYRFRAVELEPLECRNELPDAVVVAAQDYVFRSSDTEDWANTDASRWISTAVRIAALDLVDSRRLRGDV